MSGDSGISAFPEEDNIFCWKGTITGSKDTVFEGTEYKLSLSFPNDYPFKAPKVKFETTCFHPNVDVHGNICLDILQVMASAVSFSTRSTENIHPSHIDVLLSSLFINRINGHLLMMSERFFYQSKAYLEVTFTKLKHTDFDFKTASISCPYIFLLFTYLFILLIYYFYHNSEPNISSPLNPQAAQLWSNQEGK